MEGHGAVSGASKEPLYEGGRYFFRASKPRPCGVAQREKPPVFRGGIGSYRTRGRSMLEEGEV